MKKLIISGCILFGSFIYSQFSNAQETKFISAHMSPLPNELLSESILLSNCKGIKIIEWRKGSQSSKAIEIIDKTCKLSVDKFLSYANQKDYTYNIPNIKFTQSICLMPFKISDDGSDYRNLNDYIFRFKERKLPLKNGIPVAVLAWTSHQNKEIYIRNDVLLENGSVNDRFVTVFAHEMAHAMSFFYGIYQSHDGNREEQEEDLAIGFTEFVGLGR